MAPRKKRKTVKDEVVEAPVVVDEVVETPSEKDVIVEEIVEETKLVEEVVTEPAIVEEVVIEEPVVEEEVIPEVIVEEVKKPKAKAKVIVEEVKETPKEEISLVAVDKYLRTLRTMKRILVFVASVTDVKYTGEARIPQVAKFLVENGDAEKIKEVL